MRAGSRSIADPALACRAIVMPPLKGAGAGVISRRGIIPSFRKELENGGTPPSSFARPGHETSPTQNRIKEKYIDPSLGVLREAKDSAS
jgi:hypothetical protein